MRKLNVCNGSWCKWMRTCLRVVIAAVPCTLGTRHMVFIKAMFMIRSGRLTERHSPELIVSTTL